MADQMDPELIKAAGSSGPWVVFLGVVWMLRAEIGKFLFSPRAEKETDSVAATLAKVSAEQTRLMISLVDEQKRTTVAVNDQTATLRQLVTEIVREGHRGRNQ